MTRPRYSVIVPVFNRPQEVQELLDSLVRQAYRNFEVIVVEDGSTVRCDAIVDAYRDRLVIRYIFKHNSGPGPSRNVGFEQAKGDYFVVFDSDCILPERYFEAVETALQTQNLDAWGGPDQAHESFTLVQRAMGYTMSSVLTTGGIRGGKKHLGWFQPRSFNMGISKNVFERTKGFRFDRYAEDIEFSIRMKKEGFKVGLIPDAFVYHKRRVSFEQFYKQVYNFGKGRALIGRVYPQEIKIAHWFPSFFFLGLIGLIFLPFISATLFNIGFSLFFLYIAAVFTHSLLENRNVIVAFFSVPAALCQMIGYGLGFLKERFKTGS